MSTVPVEYGRFQKKRGDTVRLNVNDVLDAAGSALPLADYTLRAVIKYASDTATDDSSAVSVITGGAGITVSSTNDAALVFPKSDMEDVTGPCILYWEFQATKTATPTVDNDTLAYGEIEIVQDRAKVTA